MTQTWSEQALLLGPRKSLVGVITKPTAASAEDARPMIVILNSGIVHRVGANRMTVQLARALADAGYTTARFDLSGIGDSEPRTEALPPLDAALADIREALDSLETARKARRFVLVGLCSGANHAAIYAGSDDRVIGSVLLEPAIPPSLLHHVHHYGRKAVRLESWLRALRGENALVERLKKKIAARIQAGAGEAASQLDEPRQPHITDPEVKTFLENAYGRLIARGLPLLVVLTGESWYYRESFLDAFPRLRFGSLLQLEFFENADHVFTSRGASTGVTRLIVGWVERTMRAGSRHAA
jgi:dienelactone hydrolase